MIDKKNYFPSVCEVFTCIVVAKLILEAIMDHPDPYYSTNILFCFIITCLGAFVLSLHKYFLNVPLLFVIIEQYVLMIVFVFLIVFLYTLDDPPSSQGYLDLFTSVTIPFVIVAAIYYIAYFHQIKHANEVLSEIKEQNDRGS